jgi:hypothetical protein
MRLAASGTDQERIRAAGMGRMRVTHESLLRLIAADVDETNAPGVRHLHSAGWSLRPTTMEDTLSGGANWRLVWYDANEVSPSRKISIDKSAADFASMYDVIW